MGHTNYWRREREFNDAEWELITTEAKRIVAAAVESGIKLAGPQGTGKPSFTGTAIALNGACPEHCETFLLTKHFTEFDFCKTYQKPYDPVVVSILFEAKRLAPNSGIEPSSDGDGVMRNHFPVRKPKQKHTK